MKNFLIAYLAMFLTSTAFGQSFEIYVSDAGNFSSPPWQILKFDENGDNPSVFIDQNLAWPQDIVFLDAQEVVLISNLNSGQITKYNALTGAYIGNFATGISGPTRMKIGVDSLLYVLQWAGNGKVIRYSLDGTLVDEFTDIGVTQSIGLDWDAAGNLYVSSYSDDLVQKFDTAGISQGVFVNTNLLGPTNIWFDTNGDLLVVDYNGTAVKRYDSTGTYLNDFMTGLSNAEGVDFFPNGDILIGNGANSSVKLYDSAGTYIEDLISSGPENLLTPNAVVIREKAEVAVDEAIPASTFYVYPGIGSEFHLQSEAINPFESIQVYSLNGVLIETISNQSPVWDAVNHAEGIYLLIATFKDGSHSSQRVVVKR